ncbi:MAG TPA: hypothetical protein PLA94_32785, partial [Myxococcota bacterium]|nr:hypothetical protein [Myxococcota bacterium]
LFEQVSPPCVSGTEIPLDPALCAILAPCTEAFLTLQAQHIEADTLLARRDFDQALQRALREKALLLTRMESTCTQAATTNGPLKSAALSTLALGYSDMGDALSTSTRPPYLSPEQRELYEGALMDKAHPMREKENAAWDLAKQAAPELTELLTRQQNRVTIAQRLAEQQQELERLQRNLYNYGRPQPPVQNRGHHLGELKEERLKIEQLFQEKEACLDPETREMSQMLLEQVAAVIQEKDVSMVADIYDFVVEGRQALEAAPSCAVPAP